MKSAFRSLALGLALLLPLGAANAQVSLSPISDQIVNSGHTLTVNVVAVDPAGGAITLTSTLPAFATLNPPTTGTGMVVTTLTLTPADGDIGAHPGSITATAGEHSDTEDFQITVAAADANQPPRVTAPATMNGTEGALLTFGVTASDADADAITDLTAFGLPNGASFTANAPFTSGTFSWTPDLKQAGHYDVIFAASNAQSDSATTHITVLQSDLGPVSLAPIDDVTMAEGETFTVGVIAADPDEETISLTATLPAFATLHSPTESFATDTLATTITLSPGSGDAGTHPASVTATSGEDTATEEFTITVTGPPPALEATATLIGSFNEHKKFICFKVKPVEESFDLLLVSLSSLTLTFHGESIPAVRPTHLAFDCDEDELGDGDHDGDDDDGEDCVSCEEDRDGQESGDDPDDGEDSEDCEPSHVMACFSMGDIQALFAGGGLPDSLAAATIEGELTTGETFVATIGGKHVTSDKPGDRGHGKDRLSLRIKPNPMNPKADITFTLARSSHVRVAIYDLAGRLLATVREGEFPAGDHSIAWDGSTRSGGRVASGVYFVGVETPQVREVQRVTVLK